MTNIITSTKAITTLTSDFNVNANSKSIVALANKKKVTPAVIVTDRLTKSFGKELESQLERASLYYTIKKSKQILSSFGYDTFTQFTEKCDGVLDAKSTISQWCSVYEIFIDTDRPIKQWSNKLLLTEMVRLLSVANVSKPRLKGQDLQGEIENFLDTHFPIDGEKSWNNVKELISAIDNYCNPTAETTAETTAENIDHTDYIFDYNQLTALENFVKNDLNGKKFKAIITVYAE